MKFNNRRLKYYEANPFRDNAEDKFVKSIKEQKRELKIKKEIEISEYIKKEYKLAMDIVQTECGLDYRFKYVDDSSIEILKYGENTYVVQCDNGLLTEDEISKTFTVYNNLIEYVNKFYNYDRIEENYKRYQEEDKENTRNRRPIPPGFPFDPMVYWHHSGQQ